MRFPLRVWLAVCSIAVAVAHSRDYWFGILNQPTYFVDALRQVHPELYRHDWLVASTTMYHWVFSSFSALLFRIDDSGIYSVGVVHVLVMVSLMIAVFALVAGAVERRALAAFAIVAAWLAITSGRSLAGSYLFGGYLQPSLLASLGWVIALAAYVRGRPLATGIALALGGLFHANFLLLGLGTFTLAELLVQREQRWRRLLFLLAPQLVVLAVLAPDFLHSATNSEPTLALWVLTRFHAAVHYDPISISRALPGFARWAALAFAIAPLAAAYLRPAAARRLHAITWIMTGTCIAVALAALVPPMRGLVRLYVWRMAPFAILTAQIAIAIGVVATLDDPARWRAVPRWRLATAAALAASLVWTEATNDVYAGGWVMCLAVVAIALAVALPARRPAALPAVLAVASLAVAFGVRADVIVAPSFAESTGDAETGELYAWVRDHTPVDAQFLTPPDLGGFRLLARRAIYVDFKSPPLLPDELVAWYRRLCRVADLPDAINKPKIRERWMTAPGAVLFERARALGMQYLVLDGPVARTTLSLPPVYRNAGYAVYATGVPVSGPS